MFLNFLNQRTKFLILNFLQLQVPRKIHFVRIPRSNVKLLNWSTSRSDEGAKVSCK